MTPRQPWRSNVFPYESSYLDTLAATGFDDDVADLPRRRMMGLLSRRPARTSQLPRISRRPD